MNGVKDSPNYLISSKIREWNEEQTNSRGRNDDRRDSEDGRRPQRMAIETESEKCRGEK